LAGHRSSYVDERTDNNLNELIGNSQLSSIFNLVAKTMTLSDPKSPEDIYKIKAQSSSRYGSSLSASVDSAKGNLASTFVNAFVNAGHGRDTYMLKGPGAGPVDWIHRNKDHGKISAIASLGMVLLWNPTDAFSDADKYFHQNDEMIKAGAALAIGVASTGVRDENNATFALLDDYISSANQTVKLNAILSLGIAYAGTNMPDCKDKLLPIIVDSDTPFIEAAFAALALGMIFVGSSDPVSEDLLMRLLEASPVDLNNAVASKYFCLGLGLLYLNKTEDADAALDTCRAFDESIRKFAVVMIEACAYAGTGTVLKVQSFLKQCVEHLTEKAEHQAMAVLGIALVVLGEDVGTQMSLRSFDHLLQYGELPVKRVVPLSLALLHLSNPDYQIVDQLSRLSHDQDHVIAQNAIFGLGLVSAGTNNSRVAGLLRQLADYYSKEASHLFVVRVAQGLNAVGKGLIGINPFHSDRLLMNKAAMAGILTVFVACLEIKLTILDKYHYLLFAIATAMSPRFLVTLNADNEIEPVSVRVGQAVETVGQAGKPKTITGFQTHSTPVLLGPKDRAILANRDYIAHSSVLEGVVIVEKSPEVPEQEGASASSNAPSRISSASSSALSASSKK
jgi:26S proteasome regulatory subunit N1